MEKANRPGSARLLDGNLGWPIRQDKFPIGRAWFPSAVIRPREEHPPSTRCSSTTPTNRKFVFRTEIGDVFGLGRRYQEPHVEGLNKTSARPGIAPGPSRIGSGRVPASR